LQIGAARIASGRWQRLQVYDFKVNLDRSPGTAGALIQRRTLDRIMASSVT
jgi:hypothetical protein